MCATSRIFADGSTPTTSAPNSSASAGVNRPVPEPTSTAVAMRPSPARSRKARIQLRRLAGRSLRPLAYPACCVLS